MRSFRIKKGRFPAFLDNMRFDQIRRSNNIFLTVKVFELNNRQT